MIACAIVHVGVSHGQAAASICEADKSTFQVAHSNNNKKKNDYSVACWTEQFSFSFFLRMHLNCGQCLAVGMSVCYSRKKTKKKQKTCVKLI